MEDSKKDDLEYYYQLIESKPVGRVIKYFNRNREYLGFDVIAFDSREELEIIKNALCKY